MTSVRIEYFFTDKTCHTPSQIIFQCPCSPVKISHVKDKLTALHIIDHNSHLRFLDSISGSKVWLDIQNEDVPCPVNKQKVIQVKIVQQIRLGDSIFMQDLFKGLRIDQSNYSQILAAVRFNLFKGVDVSKGYSSRDASAEPDKALNSKGYSKFDSDVEDPLEEEESFEDEFNAENRASPDSQGKFDDGNAVDDHFDIDFGMPATQNQSPESPDFINGSNVIGTTTAKNQTDPNSLGDLDGLLDIGMPNSKSYKPAHNKNDILGMDIDFGGITNKNNQNNGRGGKISARERQVREKDFKMNFANEVDPLVKNWGIDKMRGTEKDIRTLMISLKDLLAGFGYTSEEISLSDIMSKSAVKKKYFNTIRKIHPDKTSETDLKLLYVFERVAELLTTAFKKHKNMA